jgi:hypothetical protein
VPTWSDTAAEIVDGIRSMAPVRGGFPTGGAESGAPS